MTTTIALVCRNPRHNHDARMVSRWDDGRDGTWKPRPEHKQPLGEARALIWGESEEHPNGKVHVRYKFECGAEVTQERLHSLLDEARANGEPSITLD